MVLWGREDIHGVGFIVSKEVVSSSTRHIFDTAIIQVYGPSTDHDDEEVEEFYELLENHIKTVPKKNILMIQLL